MTKENPPPFHIHDILTLAALLALPVQHLLTERCNCTFAQSPGLPLEWRLPITTLLVPIIGHGRPPGHPLQQHRIIFHRILELVSRKCPFTSAAPAHNHKIWHPLSLLIFKKLWVFFYIYFLSWLRVGQSRLYGRQRPVIGVTRARIRTV